MGKEMRTFDQSLLEQAEEALLRSGGAPGGQSCFFETDAWMELLALLSANLRGESYYIKEGD